MIERQTETDIVVYGATAAGVMACVASKRLNPDLRVTLLEPGWHVGGMVSGGLSYTDLGDPRTVGGLAREFYDRVERHYGARLVDDFAGPEPHLAENILCQMLSEAKVEVRFGEQLESVQKTAGRIACLQTVEGWAYASGVFIDASYEGDLMAGAGIPYSLGRDGSQAYGEDAAFAGLQPVRPGKHNFIGLDRSYLLSPYSDDGRLLAHINPIPLEAQGPVGCGDGKLMAFQHRLSLTDSPENKVDWPEPPGYDPAEYELLVKLIAAYGSDVQLHNLVGLIKNVPGNKIDGNSIFAFSLNRFGGDNREYVEASHKRRQEITADHRRYEQGLLYTLAHDRRLPRPLRQQADAYGPCKDEFADTGHWPHQLYVREARRMLGAYVLTQHDIHPGLPLAPCPPTPRRHADAVLMGSYNIDIREVQRTWTMLLEYHNQPVVVNEGYLSRPVRPYQVPYRCFVPPEDSCNNLLVPVCASMSHVAFASYRMETPYMMAGHAVGVAAALALENGSSVQAAGRPEDGLLDTYQQLLRQQGQVLNLA
ncbi:MAG TPA: FAD-dependent oxidoreductase [Candidatus Saccharimonadales bacterium]|nr:FAD-dependent oxidoreductase [Candidatus Saccharimonadales bacterium]